MPKSRSELNVMIQSLLPTQANEFGLQAYKEYKYETARELFQRAVKANPKDAYAWNNLGRVFAAQGKLEEAREAFAKQIAVNPLDQFAYNNLGLLYEREGRWDKAVESFREQLHVHPSNQSALANLPTALIHERRWAETEEAASKAAQAQTASPRHLLMMAVSKMCLGNVLDARKELNAALGKNPPVVLLNDAAFWLTECGRNLRLAEVYVTQALERMNGDQSSVMRGSMAAALSFQVSRSNYLDTYGWLLFKMRRLNQAVEVLNAAVSLAPKAEFFAHLAQVESKIGRTDLASRYWRQATFLEPGRTDQVPTEIVSGLEKIPTLSVDRVWYPMQATDSEIFAPSKQSWYFFVVADGTGSVQSARALGAVDPLAITLLPEIHKLIFPIVRIKGESVPTVHIVRVVKEPSRKAFAFHSVAPEAVALARELESGEL